MGNLKLSQCLTVTIYLVSLTLLAFPINAKSDYVQLKAVVNMLTEVEQNLDPAKKLNSPCPDNNLSLKNDRFLVSDSLVKNLSCKTLTPKNVLLSLQDDAFSLDKQFPVVNWSSGTLAQCWALAFSQRRLFYLTRFGNGDDSHKISDKSREQLLDMFSKKNVKNITHLESSYIYKMNDEVKQIEQFSINFFKETLGENNEVFKDIAEKNKSYAMIDTTVLAHALYSPIMEELKSAKKNTDFKSQIEKLQKNLFFRSSNIGLVVGNELRSKEENMKSMSDLQKSILEGRLPLVIVRSKITGQHAVLIKRIEKITENEFKLITYDSNVPGRDVTIDYKDGKFSTFFMVEFSAKKNDLGLFIKDEDDMDEIQNSLYKYYRNLCDNIK